MTATTPAIELKKSLRSKTILKQQLTKEERLKKVKQHAIKRETVEKLQKLFKNEPDFEPISK